MVQSVFIFVGLDALEDSHYYCAEYCVNVLQDQVDMLTFQNQSLRDKAKRFEEALRRSTDEQIVVSKEVLCD